jgi:hypothetical protein
MDKYKIASYRVGVVGADYDVEGAAANGINVAALIASGAIVKVSAPKPAKNAKKETETNEEI